MTQIQADTVKNLIALGWKVIETGDLGGPITVKDLQGTKFSVSADGKLTLIISKEN